MEIAEGGDLLDYLKVNFYKICKVQWLWIFY
jgi:hypothetical protein